MTYLGSDWHQIGPLHLKTLTTLLHVTYHTLPHPTSLSFGYILRSLHVSTLVVIILFSNLIFNRLGDFFLIDSLLLEFIDLIKYYFFTFSVLESRTGRFFHPVKTVFSNSTTPNNGCRHSILTRTNEHKKYSKENRLPFFQSSLLLLTVLNLCVVFGY